MFSQRKETWEVSRKREREVHAHTYTALICRGSHGAIEAICSLPSRTHGQTKRSPANCSDYNPHPFPKPPHTHKQTHMQMHAHPSQAARSERSPGNWTDSGFLSLRFSPVQSPFSRPAKCLINMFNQISKQPKIDVSLIIQDNSNCKFKCIRSEQKVFSNISGNLHIKWGSFCIMHDNICALFYF